MMLVESELLAWSAATLNKLGEDDQLKEKQLKLLSARLVRLDT